MEKSGFSLTKAEPVSKVRIGCRGKPPQATGMSTR